TATTTNPTTDTYPSCTSYSYVDHKMFVRRQDAAQLSVVSASAGMAEQVQVSALGRVLSQVKITSAGVALERADYAYDRLGNRARVTRFLDPNNSASVQARWDYGYDSRGAVLNIKEAGGALETRSYDAWGSITNVGWTAANGTPLAEGIRYKYDGFGRRSIEDMLGAGGAVTRHVEYHYDRAATDGR